MGIEEQIDIEKKILKALYDIIGSIDDVSLKLDKILIKLRYK